MDTPFSIGAQRLCMASNMLGDKTGDKIITVVITGLHS